MAALTLRNCYMYVNGRWIGASQGRTFAVVNPSTGEAIATVPAAGPEDTALAISAAAKAAAGWAVTTGKDRAELLFRAAEGIISRKHELARLLTLEQGKPLAESLGEVATAAEYFQWYAEEARRIYGELLPSWHSGKRLLLSRHPVGVTAAITPWNFPMVTLARKLAPALAAGCTVVLKPAEQTPVTALAMCEVFEAAGFPVGTVNVITAEDPVPVGEELLCNPSVRKLTFTGSTQVGKLLMRQAAAHVKSVSLELGGNAPFIVFDDANLDAAVTGAILCKFRNAGQTCISANRIYVQEGIRAEFTARLVEQVKALVVGDGFAPGVQIGPIIDASGFHKVQAHVADAQEHGARVLCGGRAWSGSGGGFFFEPTVLEGINTHMLMLREETFGPVALILSFVTEAEVLALANETPYGLAAYVYTRDLGRALRMSDQLAFGTVGVNDPLPTTPQAPFGGIKESGQGREGGRAGIDEFLEDKFTSIRFD